MLSIALGAMLVRVSAAVDGPSPRCIYVILCFGNQAGTGIGSGAGWR
jgi:hypothetical protein